jgi:hypothetical protein
VYNNNTQWSINAESSSSAASARVRTHLATLTSVNAILAERVLCISHHSIFMQFTEETIAFVENNGVPYAEHNKCDTDYNEFISTFGV